MKIVVLTSSQTDAGAGHHVQDLRRAAKALGHTLLACSWRDLTGSVGAAPVARAGEIVLDSADLVLSRTMPAGTLEQVVFRMDLLQRLQASGVRVINPPRAIEIAVDKYLALSRLAAAGLPVPATIVCQRYADAIAAFDQLGRDVIVKPLFGSEGFGMMRISDPDLAARSFTALERQGSVLYLQRCIDHGGSDLRLFVLGDRVLAAMRRSGAGWRTNIACGGRGEPFTPDERLCDMAVRAAAACEAVVAGVDLLAERDGTLHVLEVNAAPGWKELARVTAIDVAEQVLRFTAGQVAAAPLGSAAS